MAEKPTPTHRELCEAATVWLRKFEGAEGPGCTVAFSEIRTACGSEVVDAFGVRANWTEIHSVLVEAKVSRADFLADAAKQHRQAGAASVGTYRYYITPPGLLAVDELPPRWGLIEYGGRPRFRVLAGHVLITLKMASDECGTPRQQARHQNWAHVPDLQRELGLLTRLLGRVGDHEQYQRLLKAARLQESRAIASSRYWQEEHRKLAGGTPQASEQEQ